MLHKTSSPTREPRRCSTVCRILTVAILSVVARAEARTPVPSEDLTRDPRLIYAVGSKAFTHDAGAIRCKITNMGIIGSPFSPSFDWQGGTYLYAANLWIGATRPESQPDVSTGVPSELRASPFTIDNIRASSEGSAPGLRRGSADADDDHDGLTDEEFHNGIDDDGDGRIDEDFEAIGPQMFSCQFRDDTAEAIAQEADHDPFGLRVYQRSMVWGTHPYENFIGLDYQVTNVGDQHLSNIYIGFLVDADVGFIDSSDPFWTNDLGEFIRVDTTVTCTEEPGCAGARPVALDITSMSDAGGVDGWIGVLFLNHPIDPAGIQAPTRVGARTSVHIISAEPGLDTERYEFLSTVGIHAGPKVPGDYRMLISAGPFASLLPGESLKFQMALVVGNGRAGLIEEALHAERIYHGMLVDADNNPSTGAGGREYRLHWALPDGVTPVLFQSLSGRVDGDGVRLSFRAAPDLRIAGANVERRDVSDAGDWRVIAASIPVGDDGRGTWLDHSVTPGRRYQYRIVLLQADGSTSTSAPIDIELFPDDPGASARLLAPSPNPANAAVWIPFTIPAAPGGGTPFLTLRVTDTSGRVVRDLYRGAHPAGSGGIAWDGVGNSGRVVTGGVYFAVLESGADRDVRRIVIRR